MIRSLRSYLPALLLIYCVGRTAAQTSTTLISITQTTTVRATAASADQGNACANFNGACVVYGNGDAADYTTTIYRSAPPPSTSTPVVTSTKTYLATTTASDSAGCQNFNGACVVYGGEASSTVYYAGSSGNGQQSERPGNGDGYIAAHHSDDDGGDGQIGGTAGATALKRCTYEALVGIGLAVGVAALLV